MSTLSFAQDLNTPFTDRAVARIIGHIEQSRSTQVTAATSASDVLWHASFEGQVNDLYLLVQTKPGAGESMVYDVKKNGTSILTGTFTLNSDVSSTSQQISLKGLLDLTKVGFKPGDVFTVARTYTAGDTPAPLGVNTVVIEPSNTYVDR